MESVQLVETKFLNTSINQSNLKAQTHGLNALVSRLEIIIFFRAIYGKHICESNLKNYFKIRVVHFRQGILWIELQYNSSEKKVWSRGSKERLNVLPGQATSVLNEAVVAE